MVLAIIALVAALAGTGYAASGAISGKQIKKRSEPGNRFKKNTITGKEVKEKKLGQVPKAGDAQTLQAHPPADFLGSDKIKRFSLRLGFGQSQDIFTAGPLIFTAHCVQNGVDASGSPNSDFVQILIGTSQNGAVFDGRVSKFGDAGEGSFLNNATPDSQRIFYEAASAATGTPTYNAQGTNFASAEAPDGTAVSVMADGTAGAVNEFGTPCLLTGVAVIDNG
jgi:hypothetical protein